MGLPCPCSDGPLPVLAERSARQALACTGKALWRRSFASTVLLHRKGPGFTRPGRVPSAQDRLRPVPRHITWRVVCCVIVYAAAGRFPPSGWRAAPVSVPKSAAARTGSSAAKPKQKAAAGYAAGRSPGQNPTSESPNPIPPQRNRVRLAHTQTRGIWQLGLGSDSLWFTSPENFAV
jgi:hypothetical protein